jgi:hypothetical protein
MKVKSQSKNSAGHSGCAKRSFKPDFRWTAKAAADREKLCHKMKQSRLAKLPG